ncbi:hypothetical protein SCLCIDRAFT_845631 [Scleroderma citrinum Foug A]|uniref:Methyltransferase domain-containing protein n=1 Tax=Scleroderma citrinum Foug A TaxID=1036808 RepID=A0A0C2ZKG7_9AGAM|nr:hypothetical protein SCLCIDRAFT_845631 [Scleroderma citrinum Foug A]
MKTVTVAVVDSDPTKYEEQHVHAVYDQIASHFSSTRYKPWPIIASFLASLPTGWVGLDSGTGNGKYLHLPADRPGSILTIGMDRSWNLLQIAKHAGSEPAALVTREVVWGDVLGNGWRAGAFDYAISIATIHHLASHERRKLAVQRLLHCVSPSHGRVLIYVWAVEQDELSKRNIPTDGSGSEAGGHDVFVPWVIPAQGQDRKRQIKTEQDSNQDDAQSNDVPVYNRYYHMFAKGELPRLALEAADGMGLITGSPNTNVRDKQGCEVVRDGWERSNYYVELRRWKT